MWGTNSKVDILVKQSTKIIEKVNCKSNVN